MTSDAAWKWLVKGLGGITGMVKSHHAEPSECPFEWLEELEKHAGELVQVVREQKERRGETDQVQHQ